MVVGKSPEWLPPGFTEKVKYRNGRKFKYYLNVATGTKYHSKKEVILSATEDNGLLVTPQTKKGMDNGLSSDNKVDDNEVDAISVKTNDSPQWLPNGWIIEERTRQRGLSKGSVYKVYTDLSSGSKFYSKAAVTRYLNTVDHANTMTEPNKIDSVVEPSLDMSAQLETMTNAGGISEKERNDNSFATIDNVVEPSLHMSAQLETMTNTGSICEKKRKDNSFVTTDNVDEPSPDMSPQLISVTNTGGTCEKKGKGNSFVTVSIESTVADDLPPGWIKELKISRSGNKIRKDPYYTDPVSGYIFRSKLDALRYLKTNDIGSCACRPLKRKVDDVKLNENQIPSSNPANEELSVHKRQRLPGGELNGGGESSSTKSLAESEAKISIQKHGNYESDSVKVNSVGVVCLENKISCENLNKNAERENGTEPENNVSKGDARVMAVDSAISSLVADPSTKQQHSERGNRTKVDSRKSKKRRDSSLPLRTSKRLAGTQPEMPSNLDFSERSLRTAARRSSGSEVDTSPSFPLKASASTPLPSDSEHVKEAAEHAFIGKETRQDIDPPKDVENILNEVEKPSTEGPAIPEEQTGVKASEEQIDDSKRSQESPLCYDFGDSWSDPLEFALKTLRGDLSIDDNLAFPSCFNDQISTPYNQADGCLKQSQSDATINFQNEFAPRSESSKQNSAVDQLPAISSSFSALGNMGFASFAGFNGQSSTEVGKKDTPTKFNP